MYGVAWRDYPDCVAVVDFWSFNSYTALAMGVTSFSFEVKLGVRPLCSSHQRASIKIKDGRLRPRDPDCDLRRTLYKTIPQAETEKPYVWYVREDGSNLSEAVEDARSVLLTTGLAWFDEFTDLARILAYAANEPDTNTGTHGLGGLGSPHRAKLIADIEAASRK